jgi:hypothetical protein
VDQSQLYRSVARATGETVDVIRQVGFTLLAPVIPEQDEAERWLRRAEERRSFKQLRRPHTPTGRICAAV